MLRGKSGETGNVCSGLQEKQKDGVIA